MERKRKVDPEGYKVYGLGEWGSTEGIIFNNWKIDTLKQDIMYDDVSIGQDFGFNHANAILLLIKDNEIYILRELYENNKDTSELIELAENDNAFPKNIVMFCDAAEPDRIKMWRRAGYRVQKKEAPGALMRRLTWLKQRKIYIDSSCVNTIAEIGQWRWKLDRVSNEYTDDPVPIIDDAMAALRYGVQNWRIRGGVEVKGT